MIFRWTVRALLTFGLVVGGATSATAHDLLIGSDPADAAALTSAPAQVVLTFSADQLAVGTAVEVTGPDGSSWVHGEPVVVGSTVTQALLPGLPDGGYTVLWRSVSGDGHPVEGTLAFSLDAPDPEPVAEPVPEPVEAPTEAPTEARADDTASQDPDAPDQVDQPDVGAGPVEWLVAGLAVLAVAGVGIAVVLRRRGGGA